MSDIKTSRIRLFKPLPKRLNLYPEKSFRFSSGFLKIACIFAAAFYLVFGVVSAPAAQNEAERKALEDQLFALESQIEEYEATITEYKKQGTTLKSEISSLNAKVQKINLQIRSINLSLQKLDGEILKNKSKITTIEQSINLNKSALVKAVQQVYENESASLLMVLLKNDTLSEFFGDINNWFEVQEDLSATLKRVTKLRLTLLDEKEALAIKRNDAAALKAAQAAQQASVAQIKEQKTKILEVTKGQESKYQELLKTTKKTASEIRSRIFEFLGGGEMTFEEAYQFAKFAEKATGIRAAFILAILDKESALGQNVGKCGYKTAMHPTRDVPIFLVLTASLGINPESITVSCANRDGAYGGAMGPAQFIPSTWKLYQGRVSEITGSNPPSPWRNGDAITATAVYLKDASAGCNNTYSKQGDIERCAAAKYYAGSRWRSHFWGYGDRVFNKAQQFQQDIDILNS